MIEIVNSLEEKLEKLDHSLSDPAVLSDQKKIRKISHERKELTRILEIGREYKKMYNTLKDDRQVRDHESDEELREMAKMELEELEPQLEELEEKLKLLLVPKTPMISVTLLWKSGPVRGARRRLCLPRIYTVCISVTLSRAVINRKFSVPIPPVWADLRKLYSWLRGKALSVI